LNANWNNSVAIGSNEDQSRTQGQIVVHLLVRPFNPTVSEFISLAELTNLRTKLCRAELRTLLEASDKMLAFVNQTGKAL